MDFTINECVDAINARLSQEGLKPDMNARLLRHYQGTAIPDPRRVGRFAKYDDIHVEAVVALRKAQDMGVSSKAYSVLASTSTSTPSLIAGATNASVLTTAQHNALTALAGLQFEARQSNASVSMSRTEWTLANDARVSLPQRTMLGLTTQRRQQLDHWLSQYPLA